MEGSLGRREVTSDAGAVRNGGHASADRFNRVHYWTTIRTGSAYTHELYFKVFVGQGGSPMEMFQGLKEVPTTFTIKSGARFKR